MKNLAIIPARANSIRIKNKNIINFDGKPIIFNAIRQAIKSKLFYKIIVSTDSEKIKKIAIKLGAEVPFKRPKKLSKNNVSTLDVVKHSINFYISNHIEIDNVCCIYPATPFLNYSDLKKSFSRLKKNRDMFLISCHKSPVVIQRGFTVKNNKINLFKKIDYNINTKKYENIFLDAGQFYWGSSINWLKSNTIISKNSYIYELPFYKSIDIDNKKDLELVKIIYKSTMKNK